MKAVFHRNVWLGLGAVLLLTGLAVGVPLVADDDDNDDGQEVAVAVNDLPEAIQRALQGIEIEEAEAVTNGDRVIYEVAIEVDDDVEIELQLTANARLVGVEIEKGEGDDNDDESDDDDDERDDN